MKDLMHPLRTSLLSLCATIAVASVAGLAGTAEAAPPYTQPLDPSTLSLAKTHLEGLLARENIEVTSKEEAATTLLSIKPYIFSVDTGCPSVDLIVVNNTEEVHWAVEVTVDQKGEGVRKDSIWLPVLPPKSVANLTVPCVEDNTYSSYGASRNISLSYDLTSKASAAEALEVMVAQHATYTMSSGSMITTAPASAQPMLAEVLGWDDVLLTAQLVSAIAETGLGVDILAEAIGKNANGQVATQTVIAIPRMRGAAQAQLARALLASSSAATWSDMLLPIIDRKLCTGDRNLTLGLWLRAQSPGAIPVEALRERVSAKCAPGRRDADKLVTALEGSPDLAAAGVDATGAELFGAVLEIWKLKAQINQLTVLFSYLRGTENEERFTAATAAIPALDLWRAVVAVVQDPGTRIAPAKAAWANASLAQLRGDASTAVGQATTAMLDGKVPSEAMRSLLLSTPIAPGAVEQSYVSRATEHPNLFDAAQLRKDNLPVVELLKLDFSLGDCTSELSALVRCAEAVAAPGERPSLADRRKAMSTALRPEVREKFRGLVDRSGNESNYESLAATFTAAGLGPDLVVEHLCQAAALAMQGDVDPSAKLAIAAKLSPTAFCVASLRSSFGATKRKELLLLIFGLLAFIVPLPVGFWFVRRRWRKVKAELQALPGESPAAAPSNRLVDRLGAASLGRSLREAVSEAARALSSAPAGAALAQVGPATLDAVAHTVGRAVRSGDAATALLRGAGGVIYAVALPSKHARPQQIQRYLGAAWPEHFAAIQRAAGQPVLALILLCSPEAHDATLLVGYSDGVTTSEPEALLDARLARERRANQLSYPITLAATSPSGAPSTSPASPPSGAQKAA
jgi:hypothetical protein